MEQTFNLVSQVFRTSTSLVHRKTREKVEIPSMKMWRNGQFHSSKVVLLHTYFQTCAVLMLQTLLEQLCI